MNLQYERNIIMQQPTTIFVSNDKKLIEKFMVRLRRFHLHPMNVLYLNLSNEHTNVNHLYGENQFRLNSIIFDENCDLLESSILLREIGFKRDNILDTSTYVVYESTKPNDYIKKVNDIIFFNKEFFTNDLFDYELFETIRTQIYKSSVEDGNIYRKHI